MVDQTRSDCIQIIDDEAEMVQPNGVVVHRRPIGKVRRALEQRQVAAIVTDMGRGITVAGRSLPTDAQPQEIGVEINRRFRSDTVRLMCSRNMGGSYFQKDSIMKIATPREIVKRILLKLSDGVLCFRYGFSRTQPGQTHAAGSHQAA